MNIRQLGRTGLRVSELCLGAMTFSREAGEPASIQMLDRYLEAAGWSLSREQMERLTQAGEQAAPYPYNL
jgi:aryl-alcohol dehydrogenase-like predicted oxidoreductase